MRSFKFFKEYVNESKLPFSIETTIRSIDIDWQEEKNRMDELIKERGKDITHAHVYVGESAEQKINYMMKTWLKGNQYWIQLEENEAVIFFQDYDKPEKRYYDQDCEIILGFIPK
jgi:hypothetical protein